MALKRALLDPSLIALLKQSGKANYIPGTDREKVMTQLSDRFDRFRKKFAILHFKRIAGYQMRLVLYL